MSEQVQSFAWNLQLEDFKNVAYDVETQITVVNELCKSNWIPMYWQIISERITVHE